MDSYKTLNHAEQKVFEINQWIMWFNNENPFFILITIAKNLAFILKNCIPTMFSKCLYLLFNIYILRYCITLLSLFHSVQEYLRILRVSLCTGLENTFELKKYTLIIYSKVQQMRIFFLIDNQQKKKFKFKIF